MNENHPLFIVASAMRNPANHREVRVGRRHCDIINNAEPFGACAKWHQGFLASDGEYYSRHDAAVIAFRAGQIKETLSYITSEDLWR